MNIVFFGSSHFGIPCLRALIGGGYTISCVVTQPDKKKGRGLMVGSTLIKAVAEEFGIPVYQPPCVNNADSVAYLKSLGADLFIIIAYGQIVSQEILDIPRCMPLNVHASFLPKYRGAAPINWAIINGDETTGITVMKVIRKTDAGPILVRREIPIENQDTALTLEEKLSEAAPALLLEALKQVKEKSYQLAEQDEKLAKHAPKLKRNDGMILWDASAVTIVNLVRGCMGWPGTYTHFKNKIVKILSLGLFDESRLSVDCTAASPGEIVRVSKQGIVVACARGCVVIDRLQVEGRRSMSVEEFIAGHDIPLGYILGKK